MKDLSFFSSWQSPAEAPIGEPITIATKCGRVREGILMPNGDALVVGSILQAMAWMPMPEHPEKMLKELEN